MSGSEDSLSPHRTLTAEQKRELLAKLLRERATQPRLFPLSFAQERLWFLDQLQPGSTAYNMTAALRLKMPIDTEIFERCVQAMQRRHEALRTCFVMSGDRVTQQIAPPASPPFRFVDLSGSEPEHERLAHARRLIEDDAAQPFALARAPLFRTLLVRIAASDHIFVLSIHHIVADGWSMGILFRELTALYRAFVAGQPSPLPDLPIQYVDFASWQKKQFAGEVLQRQLQYWREALRSPPTLLDLPADRPRPTAQSFRGGSASFAVAREVHGALEELSRANGCTLFMTLIAAFQVLLYRYSGQTDVLVGTPIANRTRVEMEGVIGLFANTLVIRGKLSDQLSFRQFLGQVREVTLGAYANQDLPFEKLVEELQPERALSHNPLFQVMLVLQNAIGDRIPAEMREAGNGATTAKFDLTLAFEETSEGLGGELEYATDLFDTATATRMVGHLQTLLAAVAANPEEEVGKLRIMPDAERAALARWNTTAGYPREQCIHHRLEAQAATTPDAVALVQDGDRMTYGALNRQANRLARHLRSQGVGPESRVALCMERSLDLVVGIFGILKAGGAYVPLDPGHPVPRLALTCRDAKVDVLLSHREVSGQLAALPVQVVGIDRDAGQIAAQDDGDLHAEVRATHLAYVIYTSGSTGRPKGVAVEHRAAVHLAEAMQRVLYARFRDVGRLRVSVNAPFIFDGSVERLALLGYGHELHIFSDELRHDPHRIVEYVARERLDSLDLTPSQLKLMLDAGLLERDHAPRMVSIGGEAIDKRLWGQLRDQRRTAFFNVYGPTECTVNATACCVWDAGEQPVIGWPLPNAQVYVLDERMNAQPIGIPGEIYIAGDGLARGYLDQPELTSERFVTHRGGADSAVPAGTRLYRSGDLGRYLADGTIEFLGRIDHQIKVRGFRIEPAEIESALVQHDAVGEAVVVARTEDDGAQRLVGYVVGKPGGPAPSAASLRRFLAERFPSYMIPSAFVALASIPLTSTGKVDRNALPGLDPSLDAAAADHVEPRSETERALAQIWADVLKLPQVSVDANFFELGGHSLLITQVAARVRDGFGLDLHFRTVFELPTVAQLAAHIDRLRALDGDRIRRPAPGPAIRPGSRAPGLALPLSFSQERIWFLEQLHPGTAAYNISGAFRWQGALDETALAASVNEVVRRHEALRTRFVAVEGRPLQRVDAALEIEVPVVSLVELPVEAREDRARQLVHEASQRPFDLENGPLLRVAVVTLAPDDHVVILSMHHIVSDGWSMKVLLDELSAFYRVHAAPRTAIAGALPALARPPAQDVQYADFVAWQRDWLSGPVLHEQLAYWTEQLTGAPERLELPTDRQRPAVQTFRGAIFRFTLDPSLTARLRRLGRTEQATLFMVLLAGFAALLHRYTGQTDLVIGTPIANRQRAELERVIGLFVNTLALRTRVGRDQAFRALLREVRRVTLGAYAHQDLPFEKLVEVLKPDRNLSYSPIFQVMFGMQTGDASDGAARIPGQPHVVPFHGSTQTTSKFDLIMSATEIGDLVHCEAEYNSDLWDGATIARWMAHLQTLLAAVAANPEEEVSKLRIMPDAERAALARWNTTAGYPREQCIHHRLEAQAATTPDAVALVQDGDRMTYGALSRQANRLARHLRSQGVGPESRVALCMERSLDLVVGMFGILKAGGAYVPLDPGHPVPRLALTCRDAKVDVLLSHREVSGQLAALPVQVVCIDRDAGQIAAQDDGDLHAEVRATHLAYVIYTSGSTGRPKGVAVEHRAAVHLAEAMQRVLYARFRDVGRLRVSVNAPFIFDGSVERLALLGYGHELHIFSDELRHDPHRIVEYVARERLDSLDLTPSQLKLMLDAGLLERDHAPRMVSIGGEAIDKRLWGQLRDQRRTAFFNVYGPTECTVNATACCVWDAGEQPVIGWPLPNAQVYVLDERMNAQPIGIPGEIYIAGDGLARGYLDQPELTSERFVTHRGGADSAVPAGTRLYRSGDLGRYLADGTIEFLGRIDHQIKIRGFRIEPAEIESALVQHDAVGEAVVVARTQDDGAQRLVGYVVGKAGGPAPSAASLRRFLAERFPSYMIPSAFVALASIPLTSTGKADRGALPAPTAANRAAPAPQLAPRTPTEERLAALWAEVLGIERVGASDNFFELGGFSLMVMKLLSRIRDVFSVELVPRQIYEVPILAEQALAIDAAVSGSGGDGEPPRGVTVDKRSRDDEGT